MPPPSAQSVKRNKLELAKTFTDAFDSRMDLFLDFLAACFVYAGNVFTVDNDRVKRCIRENRTGEIVTRSLGFVCPVCGAANQHIVTTAPFGERTFELPVECLACRKGYKLVGEITMSGQWRVKTLR